MSSLFGSNYHEEWAAESKQRAQDAAEAPRLRAEIAELRERFHEYVRRYGRMGYDGPHLDHFLDSNSDERR